MQFHGRVYTDVGYVYSANTPDGNNGVYTRVGFAPSFKLFNISFSGEVSLTVQNNHVRFDYTAVNVQFDVQQYKNQVKDKYLKYLEDIKHYYPHDIAEQVEKVQDNLLKLENCRNLLSSIDYDQQLKALTNKAKALQGKVGRGVADSSELTNYQNTTDSIKILQDLAHQFMQAQQFINSHKQDLAKVEDYKNYIEKVKNTADVTELPGVSQQLQKAGLIKGKVNNVLRGVQKFGLGRININYSKFTISNQNIYGFNLEYLIKNLVYVGGGGVFLPLSILVSRNSFSRNHQACLVG